jgi:hypothetical protein
MSEQKKDKLLVDHNHDGLTDADHRSAWPAKVPTYITDDSVPLKWQAVSNP